LPLIKRHLTPADFAVDHRRLGTESGCQPAVGRETRVEDSEFQPRSRVEHSRGDREHKQLSGQRRIVAGMSHRSELPPEHLVSELVALLDDACEIDDSADLELLAGTLLLPISIPEVPEAARRVVVDAIAARADPIAAATLAALGVFAPAPLAAYAHEAAVLLAGRGVTHPAVAQVGTLSVESAAARADADTEMIVAVLADPVAATGRCSWSAST
jgi:hypothetical protein